jgi:hypothetical protein
MLAACAKVSINAMRLNPAIPLNQFFGMPPAAMAIAIAQ